jgi:hypothetical protein
VKKDPDLSGVAQYKRILQEALERRPSGTRLRLAEELGKNRSFISQITNPSYSVPIPARHVERIFEVCHFSPAERQDFMQAYERAHPNRAARAARPERWREIVVKVPDLHNADRNRHLEDMLAEVALRIGRLLEED